MDNHWAQGELSGLQFPADAGALKSGGAGFLALAFQAFGVLPASNRVNRIVHMEAFHAGGSGSKLMLTVAYDNPEGNLPEQLFIKFSRNFADELRDRARFMMVSEARFAVFSRAPDFPVTVPRCLFADVEAESGTGVIITECSR